MILRATIFHTPRNPFLHAGALESYDDGALCIEDGRILACGEHADVGARYPNQPERDLRGGVILPGLIDCHAHFPQVRVLGAIGHSLLDWLEQTTLPEESKFRDVEYAQAVASEFVHALAAHGTTTSLVFGAHFAPATALLFEEANKVGLRVISGLVLSDRFLRPDLHQTLDAAYRDSQDLIRRYHGRGRSLYAVTPRFALSASEAMLDVCRALMEHNPGVRFQTHLNESSDEIAAVAKAFPSDRDYLAVYERFGLVQRNSVFAHSVHSTPDELRRLAAHHSSVALCPSSNAALGSGIFPLRRHLEANIRVALGSDVGAGTGFGILKEGLQTYLTQRLAGDGVLLNAAQLLFLATRAGAEALNLDAQIGDFTPGKRADLVCIRPQLNTPLHAIMGNAPSAERLLSALFTLAGAECIRSTWVEGEPVYECGMRAACA